LRATDAAGAIAHGLERSGLAADVVQLPIADGGNGTLDVMLAASPDGARRTVTVRDPIGRPVRADFGLIDGSKTAVIEMALASGLELISGAELNPMRTSTYGTGELLKHALDAGATRFIVGLGGSATVDGGSGALMALGARYFDANDRPIVQRGGSILNRVARIDTSNIDPRWQTCEIRVAVDVDNPPFGERGAATVFGPQKGATDNDIPKLEAGLKQFFIALTEATTVDVAMLEGGGAAGALSAGLYGGLGAKLVSGSDLILQHIGFDAQLADADLVITGEGRMDEQTVGGKGPFGVALRARERSIPTVALVGGLAVDDSVLHDAGVDAVLPIVDKPMPLEIALLDARELLERAALRLGYMLQIGRKLRKP
ncbi:MAG: glycerate kinase, partial [Chloroflexota bacterium]